MLADRLFRRRALFIAAVALVVVFVLWNTPQLSVVLFPFRLFVTFVHEAGHGLAAILTGGRFVEFTIHANGSGVATTVGGARALILPAGYLGAALFGAALFYLAHTIPYPRHISIVLGALVIVIAILFGGLISIATIVGLVIGFALIAIGLKASHEINLLLLNILAMLTSLNAVLDLLFLAGNSSLALGATRNDAAAFQREIAPLVPASVWALLWAALAILLLGLAVYYAIIHPWRRREPPQAPPL